jgi:class 3 adenylate cyclase
MDDSLTPGGIEPAKPFHILVVDDEPDLQSLVKLRFRRQIREGSWSFIFASDGIEALEILGKVDDIDVVISDINMPRLDGLSLLSVLSGHHQQIKTVMVSAYGDMDNIRAAMNRGAFDFLTKPVDFSDFERTAKRCALHVRALRQQAQDRRATSILQQFVDAEVVNYAQRAASTPQVAHKQMVQRTVAFIDICSFTSITERNPPEFVLGLLNRYFDVIVEAIVAAGGHVDKFIGDAVMTTFDGDEAEQRCMKALVAATLALRRLRGELERDVGFFPNISAGVHSGLVIAGPVGAKVVGRLDYTVIGDVVNTAARLQDLASPGEIVCTAAVAQQLPAAMGVSERGVQSVRGKAAPLLLYSIRPCEVEYGDGSPDLRSTESDRTLAGQRPRSGPEMTGAVGLAGELAT